MRKYIIRRLLACATLMLLLSVHVMAQQIIVLEGKVRDQQTRQAMPGVTLQEPVSKAATVTNEDGDFIIKIPVTAKKIVFTNLGYHTKEVAVGKLTQKSLVEMAPSAIQLNEVVVWNDDPRQLISLAIEKIKDNYPQSPELLQGFYRETALKRQHYIYVAEGVVDMYKTAYGHSSYRDRVTIKKGRRLLSPKLSDTLSVKVLGGPNQPIQLDMVKNLDFLFNKEELANYEMKMKIPVNIDNRMQFAIELIPRAVMPYPLFFGTIYIDRETLSFTKIELSLDVSDRGKATSYMLVKKPMGVRFKPKELSCEVYYHTVDGVTRLSYIRNTFRFNCDWKKKLFSTPFTAVCEMVVTGRETGDVRPISGRQSFYSRDAFYDKVDYFLDPDFWLDYNIIPPSESLDKAIDKILKVKVRK